MFVLLYTACAGVTTTGMLFLAVLGCPFAALVVLTVVMATRRKPSPALPDLLLALAFLAIPLASAIAQQKS